MASVDIGAPAASKEAAMRFMLMMHVGHDDGREVLEWSQTDIANMIEFQRSFDRELEENGEMVFNAGLAWPDQARIVRHADGMSFQQRSRVIGTIQLHALDPWWQFAQGQGTHLLPVGTHFAGEPSCHVVQRRNCQWAGQFTTGTAHYSLAQCMGMGHAQCCGASGGVLNVALVASSFRVLVAQANELDVL